MTTARLKNSAIVGSMAAAMVLFGAAITAAQAKTVKIELVAKETTVPLDNQGNTVAAWTFNGQVPGPVIRATEGDTIEFTLKNDAANKKSHSIDMHSARTDVLTNFASIKPKHDIARGMFDVAVIIDPKDPNAMPKADREYVLIEHQIFDNPEDVDSMMANKWERDAFNAVPFQYDPVHDEHATQTLEGKPGERVRVYMVNAGPNRVFRVSSDRRHLGQSLSLG